MLEERQLRQTLLWRHIFYSKVETMSARFKISTIKEIMAKKKSKRAKGKEKAESSEPQTQTEVASMKLGLDTVKEQSARAVLKKRKPLVIPEKDSKNVIIKISRGTAIMSDPSGLYPFVDGLLFEEDEGRLADLGPVQTSKRAMALAYQALECNIYRHKAAKANQRRIKDLEKSNAALRKDLVEAHLSTGVAEKNARDAEERAKMAESTLKSEREMTQLELDSYKETLKNLESANSELTEQLEGVALEAMAKERANLMEQFLAGKHTVWTHKKWISDYKKLEAGLQLSSDDEDGEEAPEGKNVETKVGSGRVEESLPVKEVDVGNVPDEPIDSAVED